MRAFRNGEREKDGHRIPNTLATSRWIGSPHTTSTRPGAIVKRSVKERTRPVAKHARGLWYTYTYPPQNRVQIVRHEEITETWK